MPSPSESRDRRAAPGETPDRVAGLLLTGGRSRRMGWEKALTRIDGEPLAIRLGRLLAQVAAPVLEVGPGHSGLSTVRERPPGEGPLSAIVQGWRVLRPLGAHRGALILSTDLVRLDLVTLRRLADWAGDASVIPLLGDRPQPLCARWSSRDLDAAAAALSTGERSLKPLLARPGITFTDALPAERIRDADTPDELDSSGLDWARP